jgi:hypothetical protein
MALKAAIAIFGSFRKPEAEDPEIYLAAFERVLSSYPPEVVRDVADPVRGIAGEQTFMPSQAELKAACDKRMAPILARQERERIDEQFRQKRAEARAEDERIAAEKEHRAEVVRDAMLKNGFQPKEPGERRFVKPEELEGLARERRQAEVDAINAHLADLAKQPVPPLSDAAKAIFHRGNEP